MNQDPDVSAPRIEIRLTGEMPACTRCGQQALITAQVPHGWDNPDGTTTRGTLPVLLCARCDHNDPDAGPLVTYLLVHEQVTPETLSEFAALIQRWSASLEIPSADLEVVEAEYLSWRRGELEQ